MMGHKCFSVTDGPMMVAFALFTAPSVFSSICQNFLNCDPGGWIIVVSFAGAASLKDNKAAVLGG